MHFQRFWSSLEALLKLIVRLYRQFGIRVINGLILIKVK